MLGLINALVMHSMDNLIYGKLSASLQVADHMIRHYSKLVGSRKHLSKTFPGKLTYRKAISKLQQGNDLADSRDAQQTQGGAIRSEASSFDRSKRSRGKSWKLPELALSEQKVIERQSRVTPEGWRSMDLPEWQRAKFGKLDKLQELEKRRQLALSTGDVAKWLGPHQKYVRDLNQPVQALWRPQRKLSQEKQVMVYQLYQQGRTIGAIAKELKISSEAIQRIVKAKKQETKQFDRDNEKDQKKDKWRDLLKVRET